jgi:hypothetical protein
VSRSSIALLTTLVATMTWGTSQAKADFVPWSYDWEPSTIAVKAGGASSGGLNFTDEPLKHADGT